MGGIVPLQPELEVEEVWSLEFGRYASGARPGLLGMTLPLLGLDRRICGPQHIAVLYKISKKYIDMRKVHLRLQQFLFITDINTTNPQ